MQFCRCASLPAVTVAADLLVSSFSSSLTAVGSAMYHLVRCPYCRQWWRVDAFGDERERFAEKYDPPAGVVVPNNDEEQRQCLIRTFGGQTTHYCFWERCTNYRLYDCLYCVDHLLLMS